MVDTMQKFPLGFFVMTQGVNAKAEEDTQFAKLVAESIVRHAGGDWGNLEEEDKKGNEISLKEGFRLLSAYEQEGLPKIWIITEADRSVTTVLFPDEY